MSEITLYTYFRSSAAYRVRIALELKSLSYRSKYINLVKDGGEQHREPYLRMNPQALVPTLTIGANVLTQSLAIIEYLDETHPQPPLLPGSAEMRAQIRSVAHSITSDIHPLQNLRVREYLKAEHGNDQGKVTEWCRHWINLGLIALEQRIASLGMAASFLFGEAPTLAEICVIPQIYNALRYECDLSSVPRLMQVYRNCEQLSAFQRAAPEHQADAINA